MASVAKQKAKECIERAEELKQMLNGQELIEEDKKQPALIDSTKSSASYVSSTLSATTITHPAAPSTVPAALAQLPTLTPSDFQTPWETVVGLDSAKAEIAESIMTSHKSILLYGV